jgi:hypothetical protein
MYMIYFTCRSPYSHKCWLPVQYRKQGIQLLKLKCKDFKYLYELYIRTSLPKTCPKEVGQSEKGIIMKEMVEFKVVYLKWSQYKGTEFDLFVVYLTNCQ